jgi:nitrate/nitrite-specific signal transduction histidine kinase
MKSRTLHRKLNILKLLYDTNLRLTAAQFKISNANQYLRALEKAKLIKRIEVPREGNYTF